MADEETSRVQLELAFHEAGHAVVLWAFGLRVDLVTIDAKRHGSDYSGVVRHENIDLDCASDEVREKMVAVSYAGREAVRTALHSLGGDRWRNAVIPQDDFLGAEKAASYFADPAAAKKRGLGVAQTVLRDNWARVAAVAERVHVLQDLDGKAFLDVVNGPLLDEPRITEIVHKLRTVAELRLRAALAARGPDREG